MVHVWQCSITFSSCSWGTVECVSMTADWVSCTNSMACSFPWFKSLRFSSLVKPEAYYLCYRIQRRPGLATTRQSGFEMILMTPGIFHWARQQLLRCATSCNEAQDGQFEQFFNHQEVVTQKPCLKKPIAMKISTCICLTAGVNLLTPSTVRFLTSSQWGLTCVGAECGKEGGMDHTSIAALTNQLCSDRGVVHVFEYSINVLYYKYGRNQSWRY